jgi:signal peptidase I
MSHPESAMRQTKWPAIAFGMLMPGLGQIYNGELLKGLCFFSIYQMIALIGVRLAVRLSDRLLIIGVGLVLICMISFYIWTIVETVRKRNPDAEPKKYNRWYFYLAVWLVCMVGINGAIIRHIRTSTLEAFKIVGASMQPAVLRGDYVLVDKTAYQRQAPHVNDVVVLFDPDNRSIVLLRKIAALPGQAVPQPNVGRQTVPHGMVYVSGEISGADDSSRFGFIPLRDLLGKARQIYWSSGPHGIRWNRIGMKVPSAMN